MSSEHGVFDALTTYHQRGDLRALLIPAGAGKDKRSRLGKFCDWLEDTGRTWDTPDLSAYRDAMLSGELGTAYAPATVNAHLAVIRSRYGTLLKTNGTREALYERAGETLRAIDQGQRGVRDNPANRSALVNEAIQRLLNDVDPENSQVTVTTYQDRADAEHVRLTREQAIALLKAPGLVPLLRLRDTAILGLLLCTGIRERELCGLEVGDLWQRQDP